MFFSVLVVIAFLAVAIAHFLKAPNWKKGTRWDPARQRREHEARERARDQA